MIAKRLLLAVLLSQACGRSNGKPPEDAGSRESPAVQAEPLSASRTKPRGTPQPKLPLGSVILSQAGQALNLAVEVADTDAQRQMGLMFRESLRDGEGMLFVFPTERYNSFWMHNTLIPLDLYFIDSDWNVVGVVEQATPLTDDPRQVEKMSRYVLEVRGGFAAAHQIRAGAKVVFVPPVDGGTR